MINLNNTVNIINTYEGQKFMYEVINETTKSLTQFTIISTLIGIIIGILATIIYFKIVKKKGVEK